MVKAIFNKAISWGEFYGANPGMWVKKKREPNHRLRYLSETEMKELLRVAHPRLHPLLACALSTGMRKGEILNMDWRDVDFTNASIQMTMRYAHLSNKHIAEKMAQLGNAFSAINYAPRHSSDRTLTAPPQTL